jgi:peptidoglycan/LPS O-acetylase OafA/YrhL
MKYRSEIDGLRALAVVPVILFHAGFELFSGGFVGVDVFFVISGYLITTILIDDLEKKRFSIINFYERRAKRILPVLFVVILICTLFAWILLSDAALNKFGNGLIGVSFFVSNIVFWRQQGYFEESAELNPILHTWSLSVEEQYYVLFPIFLIIAWRYGKSKVFWMIVVMAVISLLLSEWGWRNNPTANFFLAPTRAWELFAGSMAAFIVNKHGVQKNNFLACVGLIAIFYSIFAYDKSIPFPSVYSLVPVLGVVLLVLYAEKKTLVAKILSNKYLVNIGLISYSAYLWHQPIFAFYRIYNKQISLDWSIALSLIVVTLVLSYLSWRWIEKPVRSNNLLTKYSVFLISVLFLIVIFVLGFSSKQAVTENEYKLAELLSHNDYVYFENIDERKFMEGRLIHPLKSVDSIVVGSSRVMQIDSNIIGKKIQSFTVSGASIEDQIALGLEALAKLNYQNIYIAADPWLLNQYDGQDRYQSISELYDYWNSQMQLNLKPMQYWGTSARVSKEIVKNNHLNSLRNFLMLYNDRKLPFNGQNESIDKKAYDGSHIYNQSYANKTLSIDKKHSSVLNYAMKEFEYSYDSIKKLESFVAYLKSNSVNVTFVLSPYHPEIYQQMKRQKPLFLEIEHWYRKFAEKNNISIIGSYDGKSFGCKENEFYDGMHPKNSCMQKLF